VSVYGLGRFPVTLYKEQWTKPPPINPWESVARGLRRDATPCLTLHSSIAKSFGFLAFS
jgi:hypothetical protein